MSFCKKFNKMHSKNELVVFVLATVIGKLKLAQMRKADLENRQMNIIKGGECPCACACGGPSSTYWNSHFNNEAGHYMSGGGGVCECCCEDPYASSNTGWRAWEILG